MFTVFALVSGFRLPLPSDVVELTSSLSPDRSLLAYRMPAEALANSSLKIQLYRIWQVLRQDGSGKVYSFGITSIADWDGESYLGTSQLLATDRLFGEIPIHVALHRYFEQGVLINFEAIDPVQATDFFVRGYDLCDWFDDAIVPLEDKFRGLYDVFACNSDFCGALRDNQELMPNEVKVAGTKLAQAVRTSLNGILDEMRAAVTESLGGPLPAQAAP